MEPNAQRFFCSDTAIEMAHKSQLSPSFNLHNLSRRLAQMECCRGSECVLLSSARGAQVHFNLSLGRAFGGTVVAKPIMLWLDPFLRSTLADLIVWPNRIVVPLSYDPDFDYSVLEMRCALFLILTSTMTMDLNVTPNPCPPLQHQFSRPPSSPPSGTSPNQSRHDMIGDSRATRLLNMARHVMLACSCRAAAVVAGPSSRTCVEQAHSVCLGVLTRAGCSPVCKATFTLTLALLIMSSLGPAFDLNATLTIKIVRRHVGVLKVEVICAQDLKKYDVLGKSDPFLEVFTLPLHKVRQDAVTPRPPYDAILQRSRPVVPKLTGQRT